MALRMEAARTPVSWDNRQKRVFGLNSSLVWMLWRVSGTASRSYWRAFLYATEPMRVTFIKTLKHAVCWLTMNPDVMANRSVKFLPSNATRCTAWFYTNKRTAHSCLVTRTNSITTRQQTLIVSTRVMRDDDCWPARRLLEQNGGLCNLCTWSNVKT